MSRRQQQTMSSSSEEGEKYSLRPRSIAKRLEVEQKLKLVVVSTGGGKTGGGGHGSVRQRMQRTPKPKQKPAPLSKYRRKTANARERSRMKEINQAFETLRKAIPQNHSRGDGSYSSGSVSSPSPSSSSSSSCGSSSGSEKWTKITTLRLAMDYIDALNRVLEHDALLDDLSLSGGSASVDDRLSGSLSSLGSVISGCGGGDDLAGLSDADLDSFDDIPNIPVCCVPVDVHCDMDTFDIFLESDECDSLQFHHSEALSESHLTT